MRAYYYLLFRIFKYYTEKGKESDKVAIIRAVLSTSLLIYFTIYTILIYFDNYFFEISNIILPNKGLILLYLFLLGFLNYWFFIKDRKFLNYNFKSDKKGGYAIIGFIIFLALSFVFIAIKNREKIFNERAKARIENNQ